MFASIAKSIEVTWPGEPEAASLRIAQRLSISLQRENARAILRRLADPSEQSVAIDQDEDMGAEDFWWGGQMRSPSPQWPPTTLVMLRVMPEFDARSQSGQ